MTMTVTDEMASGRCIWTWPRRGKPRTTDGEAYPARRAAVAPSGPLDLSSVSPEGAIVQPTPLYADRCALAYRRFLRPWRYAAGEPSPLVRAAAEHFGNRANEIYRMVVARLRRLGLKDDERRDAMVQQAVSLAWHSFRRDAERNGAVRPELLNQITWWSIKQALAGRELPGLGTRRSVMAGPLPPSSTEVAATEEPATTITPDQVATGRESVESLHAAVAGLPASMRARAEELVAGESTGDVASRHGVTKGAISQLRGRLAGLVGTGEPPESPGTPADRTFGEGGRPGASLHMSRLARAYAAALTALRRGDRWGLPAR